jgi:hypothetical protein
MSLWQWQKVQFVSIYRVMFPHDSIPDEFYEHVVQKLDEKAGQNQNLPCFLSEGVEALNALTGSAWFGLYSRFSRLWTAFSILATLDANALDGRRKRDRRLARAEARELGAPPDTG